MLIYFVHVACTLLYFSPKVALIPQAIQDSPKVLDHATPFWKQSYSDGNPNPELDLHLSATSESEPNKKSCRVKSESIERSELAS